MSLDARQRQLVEDHVPMARSCAWGYFQRSTGIDLDEVAGWAYLGLVQAAEAWPGYCAARGYDPSREDYFRAYALRRVKGSILDAGRHADVLTRTDRRKIRAALAAEDAGISGEAELAAAAGITPAELRRLRSDAQMPVSLEHHAGGLEGGEGAFSGLPDEGPDIESQARVHVALAGMLATWDVLDAETRVVLALRFLRGMTLEVVAKELGVSKDQAVLLHDAGVLAIHAALLASVSEAEGPGGPARLLG